MHAGSRAAGNGARGGAAHLLAGTWTPGARSRPRSAQRARQCGQVHFSLSMPNSPQSHEYELTACLRAATLCGTHAGAWLLTMRFSTMALVGSLSSSFWYSCSASTKLPSSSKYMPCRPRGHKAPGLDGPASWRPGLRPAADCYSIGQARQQPCRCIHRQYCVADQAHDMQRARAPPTPPTLRHTQTLHCMPCGPLSSPP